MLASADKDLDIERPLAVASRELSMNSGQDEFVRIDRMLAGAGGGNFLLPGTLVGKARVARFRVRKAHSKLCVRGLDLPVRES